MEPHLEQGEDYPPNQVHKGGRCPDMGAKLDEYEKYSLYLILCPV